MNKNLFAFSVLVFPEENIHYMLSRLEQLGIHYKVDRPDEIVFTIKIWATKTQRMFVMKNTDRRKRYDT